MFAIILCLAKLLFFKKNSLFESHVIYRESLRSWNHAVCVTWPSRSRDWGSVMV